MDSKNNYPLPLILDIVENIGTMSGTVHTRVKICKMDLEMCGLVE